MSLAPLGLLCAFVTLFALTFTGWGFTDMTASQRLRSDAVGLGLVAVSGATAGVLLLLAITGRASGSVLACGAALGCVPVAVRVLSYLTRAF